MRLAMLGWAAAAAVALSLGACDSDNVENFIELSPAERSSLFQVRDTQKLSHDVYQALHGIWGDDIFAGTAADDLAHAEAVKTLIDEFGVLDPSAGDPPGRFANPAFQQRHDRSVGAGSASRVDALAVGVSLEETSIVELERWLDEVHLEDIEDTFRFVLCRSRNHLRAFNAELNASGARYAAQDLAQAAFDALAFSAPERC